MDPGVPSIRSVWFVLPLFFGLSQYKINLYLSSCVLSQNVALYLFCFLWLSVFPGAQASIFTVVLFLKFFAYCRTHILPKQCFKQICALSRNLICCLISVNNLAKCFTSGWCCFAILNRQCRFCVLKFQNPIFYKPAYLSNEICFSKLEKDSC